MIAGIGIDLVEIARFRTALRRHGDRLLRKLFTARERRTCERRRDRLARYAARFAGKEAVLKALGTGWSGGIGWTDVEIVSQSSGAVRVKLSGAASKAARTLGIRRVLVSLTHTARHAAAAALAQR